MKFTFKLFSDYMKMTFENLCIGSETGAQYLGSNPSSEIKSLRICYTCFVFWNSSSVIYLIQSGV